MKFKYLFVLSILSASLFSAKAFAATVSFTADKLNVNTGDTVKVVLTTDTKGSSINAAQGIVRFSPGVLQLVSTDRTASVFNFWVEDPNISNTVGTMSFTAGTTKGISGTSLNILSMTFKATGSGISDITFSDGAVTADDGLGTNLLATINKATINVSGAAVSAAVPAIPEVVAPVVAPQAVIRAPTPTGKLPIEPTVEIGAYPDETRWYNQIGEVAVFWNVPRDVTAVAVSIDKNPNGRPSKFEAQLFDGKVFDALTEGVWYVHVRFKNNVGNGPVASHKISLDIDPPKPFNIFSSDGSQSDNPSPTLNFETTDGLSGIDYYSVIIDDKSPLKSVDGSLKLPPQEPGDHTVRIIAYDKAGNLAEAAFAFKTIPIASPEISLVSQPLYSDTDNNLRVSGTGLPGTAVLLVVSRVKDGFAAGSGSAKVDDLGLFSFIFQERFGNGTYKITARSQDERGALSEPVYFSPMVVKSKPVLTIGFIEFSSFGLLVMLFIILMGSFTAGYYFYKFKRESISRKVFVTKQDIAKVSMMIKKDLEDLQKAIKTEAKFDEEFVLAKLEEDIAKIDKYIQKEIESIGK